MILRKEIKQPQIGDVKTLKRFAWWPIIVGNKLIWFEPYEILIAYIASTVTLNIDNTDTVFMLSNWTTISKRLLK